LAGETTSDAAGMGLTFEHSGVNIADALLREGELLNALELRADESWSAGIPKQACRTLLASWLTLAPAFL